MDLQTVRYKKGEGIATITMNRPEKRNPLNTQVFKELSDCLDDASADKSIGALIITGGEKVFCAGMDIAEMQQLKQEEIFTFWNSGYNLTFEKIYNFRVPTIAAVSGYCLAGGFDLSISCDFRIASETARFGQLEVDVHLSPGIDRLWRLVGLSRAKYLGMTGEIIDAAEAYRIGLVDKIVKVENLMTATRALAAGFASKPRESLEKTKQSYLQVINMDHQAAIAWETKLLSNLFDNEDRRRIMEHFLRKK
jgi:enoyl-CoA hydratase